MLARRCVRARYNERPYNSRGWCVAESIFATECLLHLEIPLLPRAKATVLAHDGATPLTEQPPTHRTNREVLEALERATFTGKGDAQRVERIVLAHDIRLRGILARRRARIAARADMSAMEVPISPGSKLSDRAYAS